jgi:hypothetical protein
MREIALNGIDEYIAKRPSMQKRQAPSVSPPVIGPEQRAMLRELAHALRGANVRVIVSPTFDRVKLAPADLAELQALFTVSDFSGSNAITDDARNYYDDSHYNLMIGRQLLERVYGAASASQP